MHIPTRPKGKEKGQVAPTRKKGKKKLEHKEHQELERAKRNSSLLKIQENQTLEWLGKKSITNLSK